MTNDELRRFIVARIDECGGDLMSVVNDEEELADFALGRLFDETQTDITDEQHKIVLDVCSSYM